ncbi:MAG: hypothetical protein ACI9UO_003141 [Nitrospinales bacterium]
MKAEKQPKREGKAFVIHVRVKISFRCLRPVQRNRSRMFRTKRLSCEGVLLRYKNLKEIILNSGRFAVLSGTIIHKFQS